MDIPVIKPDTALAVAYGDGEKRVYFQEQSGWIREATYDRTHGWRNGIRVVQLEDSSPIAVAYESLNKIRLYYLIGDILHEQFYDGDKWKEGSLGAAGFSVSRTTSLAARYINGEPRVYAQLVDTSIHEYQHANNEWKLTYNFGAGFNDTGIVAPATGKHQLFYQSTESFIIEKIAEGSGWKDGKLKVRNDEANTPIVAVTFGDDSHRVYHLNSEHYIVESAWDAGDDDWTTNVSEKKVNSGSKLAGVTFLLDAYPNIQLYLQDQKGGKTISEYVHQYGSVWITHTGILPVK